MRNPAPVWGGRPAQNEDRSTRARRRRCGWASASVLQTNAPPCGPLTQVKLVKDVPPFTSPPLRGGCSARGSQGPGWERRRVAWRKGPCRRSGGRCIICIIFWATGRRPQCTKRRRRAQTQRGSVWPIGRITTGLAKHGKDRSGRIRQIMQGPLLRRQVEPTQLTSGPPLPQVGLSGVASFGRPNGGHQPRAVCFRGACMPWFAVVWPLVRVCFLDGSPALRKNSMISLFVLSWSSAAC